MSLSVSFRHSARAEFIEAAAWYEGERQNLGVEFIAEIERCVDAAAERPMTYAAIDNDVRSVVANRFPFSVYFRAVASAARSKSCRVFG
jgi:toxin ParE1/3/4